MKGKSCAGLLSCILSYSSMKMSICNLHGRNQSRSCNMQTSQLIETLLLASLAWPNRYNFFSVFLLLCVVAMNDKRPKNNNQTSSNNRNGSVFTYCSCAWMSSQANNASILLAICIFFPFISKACD